MENDTADFTRISRRRQTVDAGCNLRKDDEYS